MFRVISWNVNSANMRLERILAVLKRHKPDALCLQELKCMDDKFPYEAIEAAGYHPTVYGQKAYNGVAILSKVKVRKIQKGFGDKVDDPAARFVAATVGKTTVMSAYIPNGQSVGSEQYDYKMRWLDRLKSYLHRNFSAKDKFVLMGDFNVAPDERDVYDPKVWEGKIHFSEPERKAIQGFYDMGLVDTFRLHEEKEGFYSWWDYRHLSFPKNRGLRIDYVLASPAMAKLCRAASIDRDERKGKKPSDHVPVIADFDL